MSLPILTNIDLNKNQLLNPRLQNLSADPVSPVTGQAYFNTTTNRIRIFNGTTWDEMGTGGGSVISVDLSLPGSVFSVSGSPVTSSGTLTGNFVNQNANEIFAGPSSGGAATPAFRGLVPADVPPLDSSKITTGQLSLGRGGTNSDLSGTGGTSQVLRQSSAGAAITVGQLSNTDIAGLGSMATQNSNSVTITGGSIEGTTLGITTPADARIANLNLTAQTQTLDLNNQRISNLGTPVSGTDAANKAYVDAVQTGLDIKDSVRVASTANLTLSGSQTVDGVSVIAGDRILVKDQTTGSENGIYVVAGGTWSRSLDADSNAEVTAGLFTFVEEGSTQSDSGWVLTTNNPITLGTTVLSFTQFSGAGQVSAGAGLIKTGNTLDVVGTAGRITVNADSVDIDSSYVGQTSITTLGTIGTGTWNASTIAVAKGGTGATDAAGARANLGATTKFSQSIGDGSATSIGVTHNLGTRDVNVMIYDTTTFAQVFPDVTLTSTNVITLGFTTAPTTNQYRVVVIG